MKQFKHHLLLLTFMLLLELDEELRVVLYLVVDVLLTATMLFAAEGGRVLQVDSAVLTIEVRHDYC